jgi:hypothetical protein
VLGPNVVTNNLQQHGAVAVIGSGGRFHGGTIEGLSFEDQKKKPNDTPSPSAAKTVIGFSTYS